MFVVRHKEDENFPDAFLPADNEAFWKGVTSLELTLRPLAKASLRMQKHSLNLADVVVTFVSMYMTLSQMSKSKLNARAAYF